MNRAQVTNREVEIMIHVLKEFSFDIGLNSIIQQ